MGVEDTSPQYGMRAGEAFPSTCWTRLQSREEQGAEALRTLAARYWPAVVAWLQRGLAREPALNEDQARDAAQGFFVWVLETGFLDKADPARGRFRAFLKTALRRFVASSDRRERAAKRGGSLRFVPLATQDGEALELASAETSPDQALDAAWRATLISGALERTRERLEERGQFQRYQIFHAYHIQAADGEDYSTLAQRFGVSRVDVSNHLARAKNLFREELRSLVLETVGTEEDLRVELGWLFEDSAS